MSDSCCDGHLDAAELEYRQRRVLIIVLLINVVSFVVMAAGSILSGSSSLLSGMLDNLGDALTYGLSLAVVGASHLAKARVALFKGVLIAAAALIVATQIYRHFLHLEVPMVEAMGIAALVNLFANLICLWLLTPFRHSDINMSSVWECSRNDTFDGVAVLIASFSVWIFGSAWPDILVAIILLLLFTKSALRVLRGAWNELKKSS
ncbi:Co/Zn/Cd efflux system component [Nitrosomonas marina]|uniref:Co/Zn/Cd efflux system component n=1 Tax=Nitrosomonas marina TaxID=917 RepID=A0A1H9ZDU1_9PROT|nr:cation transporter [Nitrosomonas marina]SES79750.1 Co/Zn/Cd efflux system component [Nitrosomonas marina]